MNGEACGVPMCVHVVAKRYAANGKKPSSNFQNLLKFMVLGYSGTSMLLQYNPQLRSKDID